MPTKTTKKAAAKPATAPAASKRGAAKTGARKSKKSITEEQSVAVSQDQTSADHWTRVDLHVHTPGSHDYEQPDKSYIDILRQAERRGLKMIGFTDHNTVNGYRNMMREIELLELLEKTERIRPDELSRLAEYRRLLKKVMVLPGFEFTATFGFHILGLFSPDKPVREIEHVLMQLKVPNEVIEKGLTEAGATSDVLTAYQLINAAGGIAIAAHANSSNGVSMRNLNLGGQTRMAFTQDPNLLAIEFTDLDKGPRRSSAYLFSGVRPEYPRRMFAIQGSDAHRVIGDPSSPKRLGVGDRATELQLPEVSFKALRELFQSNKFEHVRPVFDRLDLPPDLSDVESAREAGAGPGVAFYPALPKKGNRLESVLQDICAMSNGDGGVIFIGCGDKSVKKIAGLPDARKVAAELSAQLPTIVPQALATLSELMIDGKTVLRITVLTGRNPPYVIGERAFYVRKGATTALAARDEIVALVRRAFDAQRPAAQQSQPHDRQQARRDQPQDRQQRREQGHDRQHPAQQHPTQQQQAHRDQPQQQQARRDQQPARNQNGQQRGSQNGNRSHQQDGKQRQPQSNVGSLQVHKSLQGAALQGNGRGGKAAAPKVPETPVEPLPAGAPKTGVQVLSVDERNGGIYFTVRDLRNNLVVRNVTMKSARDLWHYAISEYADHPGGPEDVSWTGNRAVLAGGVRAGKMRYDLALRDEKGASYVFYGVMQEGLDDNWKDLIAAFNANNGGEMEEPQPTTNV